jgi:hypothetical protein
MSSDLIGRRRASEQRLDRARSLELSLKEKIDVLVETTGMSIEQLDFDGSFRAALTALAAVASRRTHFDIIVTLPDAPFAMRIQHVNNAVSAEVLIQRDGPFEAVSVGPASTESATPSVFPPPLHETPTYAETSGIYANASNTYLEPSHGAVASYADSAAASAYAATSSYSDSTHSYSESLPAYSNSSKAYSEFSSGHSESLSPRQSVSSAAGREPVAMVQVASDLAELLWQGVDDMPS